MLPEAVTLFEEDIVDAESVNRAVQTFLEASPNTREQLVVFHCAGLPEQFFLDESIFERVNVEGTRNVLNAALEHKARRVVYTSTMDVFAKDQHGTLVETYIDPQPKHSAYERSKQQAERVCDEFQSRGLPVILLNCSAVYGPSPVLTGVNELFVQIAHGEVPFLMPGGCPLVYIDGVAKAHVDAVELGNPGERYLLADCRASVVDMANHTSNAYAELFPNAPAVKTPSTMPAWVIKTLSSTTTFATRRLRIGKQPLVPRGVVDLLLWDPLADTSKAERELGFKPYDVAAGFRNTLTYMSENGFLRPVPQK